MTLRIAVPDGALRAPSLEMLAAAGVGAGEPAPPPDAVSVLDARLVPVAAADVPLYLAGGAADAGLVAKDVLLERETGLCELLDLRFGAALLVHAATPGAAERAGRLGRLRIATRHPLLTRAYFSARGVEVTVVEVVGGLDRAVADGLADGVVTLVEAVPGTGVTAPAAAMVEGVPRAASADATAAGVTDVTAASATSAAASATAAPASVEGLVIEGVVATSSVRLVAARGARVLRTAELGTLVARLRDLTARRTVT